MENRNNETPSYLENASLFLLGILFLIFPLFMLTFTTDAFTLPKQIILGAVVLISIALLAVKTVIKRQVIIRRSPLDLAIILFLITVLLSSIFAVNKADSLINFVPFFSAVLIYFVIINVARTKNSVLLLNTSLITGACILSILSILSFFKIYILPFNFTRIQTFTSLGSLLDQALYLLFILPIAIYFASPIIKSFSSPQEQPLTATEGVHKSEIKNQVSSAIIFAVMSVIILIALVLSTYKLFATSPQNGGLVVLPFETGFQTAFAEISQDTGRVLQGFLFGSGFGTYITDFTRYKQATFNQNQNLWALPFFKSSNFVLELLATTGVLGFLAFLFLVFKIFRQRRVFVLFLIPIIASFLLSFSFTTQALFFIILALLMTLEGSESGKLFDIELQLVALKKGLITFDTTPSKEKTPVLPSIIFIIIFTIVGIIGYFSIKYFVSDFTFQSSLVAASQNNGSLTYKDQADAISTFPYRDAYYRFFSQTNLALANSLAAAQPKGSSPSAQIQQTIFTLIQQSINAGRQATIYAPQTMLNWQNLASIYRSLIGFGQNADSFAILASQQAVVLDPNNPQEYINLGGIYYQLAQWDNAVRQFQIAISLKPDYANAYYNLGHALQEKGNLNDALSQYQIVKRLVANNPTNLEKITKEIEDLQKTGQPSTPSVGETEQPLTISSPSAQLPPQNPLVKIPPPLEATKSSESR